MLKVASMRLRGQVDALKEMGEDAEGVSTDLTKIQQQVYELTGKLTGLRVPLVFLPLQTCSS